jgi:hypothetical protein
MVALRSFCGPEGDVDARRPPLRKPHAADWLSLQQAACELDVSVSTVRRMIRRGQLRNRIVPRPGGFAYLIYLPNSRHALLGAHNHRGAPGGATRASLRLVDDEFEHDALEAGAPRDHEIERLETQVEQLWHALARALRDRRSMASRAEPTPAADDAGPYARYRALARKRRWWRF